LAISQPPADESVRLLRSPDVSAERVTFVYANDVWVADRAGGDARRLTTFEGAETHPHFSPDGSRIAFSAQYDGNTDVYVVGVEGGRPERLTWHPGPDHVQGWTPDGEAVLFASGRINAPRSQPRLWTISLNGGMPDPLPLPRASTGAYSVDGSALVYQRVEPWETEFRNYRGGQAQPIRIIDLETLEVEALPWDGSNDISPAWVGEDVFFLSDRDHAHNVWSRDPEGRLAQRTFFTEFDCKSLEGGDDAVIFENGGYLYVLGRDAEEPRRLDITLRGDFPWARPRWEDVTSLIRQARISPTGQRALFEARGEIFTVPAEKGDARNITRSPGAADRTPSWSPDGRWIARFSDASGEYRLVITDQFGDKARDIELKDPSFYYTPAWSPDSEHLAFTDNDRTLFVVEVSTGEVRRVDNAGFATPTRVIYPAWSPDSRWIAYTRRLDNQFNAVFVYSLETGERHQITDGMADVRYPAWDASGRHLAFMASTDYGLNVGWLDMSSYERPLNHRLYLAVLDADDPSPLAPESDEEKVEEAGTKEEDEEATERKEDADSAQETTPVEIDFEGLARRIVATGVPAGSYQALLPGEKGVFFYLEQVENGPGATLHRYDLDERESEEIATGLTGFDVSADGSKLLLARSGNVFAIADAQGKPSPEEGKLDLSGMKMKVDPQQEWEQIFTEAWRFQRDFFYVENVHGLDMDWAYGAYRPWVDHVRHRSDLTYVLDILGGETAVGHSFTGGGDLPDVDTVPVGLLGADFEEADGRFRITRIYTVESWNPDLRAPLSGPGLDVAEGDYLLAVDGRPLRAGTNLYSAFDRTAGRQVDIAVNDRPELEGARELTVVPVEDEEPLRRRAWVEGNRRKVDELSEGKLAYVWVPDTGMGGYTYFTRYYFAQQDKKGAIIDERFNHGGSIADYMVDIMNRELIGYFNNPVGNEKSWTAPNAQLWGPKVMLINEMSGSGGDMLPYMFRKLGIGPLVGTRTWGGLVGIWDVPSLIDGGYMTAPRGGFYDTAGAWAVENEGVAPDVKVEQLPRLVHEGRDPQLEEAVRIALERLETEGVELLPPPEDPVRVRRP
jgi:tricorn protease